MPVTARLSSRFYEKMGDEATAELVNWLNDVDAEFRAQLRDSNNRNWDRFRADMNTLKAELRAEMASMKAELRSEFQSGIAGLRAELHSELRLQLRWMFAFWATTLLAIAGLKLL